MNPNVTKKHASQQYTEKHAGWVNWPHLDLWNLNGNGKSASSIYPLMANDSSRIPALHLTCLHHCWLGPNLLPLSITEAVHKQACQSVVGSTRLSSTRKSIPVSGWFNSGLTWIFGT